MEINELEDIVNNKLHELGMNELYSYKNNIRDYLIKIEEYIQDSSTRRIEIYEEYKSIKINMMSISKNTKIARQTIYNNREVLEKYIHFSQDEFEKNDAFIDMKKKDEIIIELRSTIEKLYNRDLKEQLKLDEIGNLEREKESLIKELKILNKNNELLHKEIDSLRRKIKQIDNVSDINSFKEKNDG